MVLDSDDNQLTRNTARGAAAIGIVLDATDQDPTGSNGNVLDGNVASGNGDDGVGVFTTGNTVKGTTAEKNLKHGIEAVAGTIDGGGNRASGNGVEPQCTGVACS